MELPEGFVAWPITARPAWQAVEIAEEKAAKEGKAVIAAQPATTLEAEKEEKEDERVFAEDTELYFRDLAADGFWEIENALDRGINEVAERLLEDEAGDTFARRTKVVEALLRRGWSKNVLDKKLLDTEPWDFNDCANSTEHKVGGLAHDLDRIVGMHGKIVPLAVMSEKQRRDLRLIAQVEDVNFDALPPFIPPRDDTRMRELAVTRSCKLYSSTSSLTGLLSKCYFAITKHHGVNLNGLSSFFQSRTNTHSPAMRLPSVSYLTRTPCGNSWSITAASEDADTRDNVLMELGKSMEYQVTMPKDAFEARFLRRLPKKDGVEVEAGSSDDSRDGKSAGIEDEQGYRFLQVGDILMRSQIDAQLGGKIFDLKTRVVAPVRYDVVNYLKHRDYRLDRLLGAKESYELEIYDMMRGAFIKYGLQARIGRMDGIFVTYHNTAEIFGFQYVSLADMDACVYGSSKAARVAFDLSSKTMRAIMDLALKDPDVSRTGLVKCMLLCDVESEGGNVLDFVAAPVFTGASGERLGDIKRWHISLDTFGPSGEVRPPGQPLAENLRVYLSAEEVLLEDFLGRNFLIRLWCTGTLGLRLKRIVHWAQACWQRWAKRRAQRRAQLRASQQRERVVK